MKKILLVISLVMLAISSSAMARGYSYHSSSRGGYYAHSSGSSHKGGSYRNAATNNHYQKRH